MRAVANGVRMAQRDFGSPFDGLGVVLLVVLALVVVLGVICWVYASGIGYS